MKRSISVPLIFLGTLGALSACSDDPPANTEVHVKQDFYVSLDDCREDWGSEPENCQQAHDARTTSSTGSHGSSLYHYSGPRYFWYRNASGGHPMALDADGKTRPVIGSRIPESGAKFASQSLNTRTSMPTHMAASPGVVRSGFGSTGRGHSAGG